jgi:hydroxymethylbilane synthase
MQTELIKIGTRGSKLALIQSQLVINALRSINPKLAFKTIIIKTEGDRNFAPIPLDTVGKEWFTAEIDRALAAKDIDIAVHSLKDIPAVINPDLSLITALQREDPRDALISKTGSTLMHLPPGAIVGTDSTRRKALLQHARPDLNVVSLRGNVQTRMRKLHEENYDAIILAAAGLARLSQIEVVTEFLDPTTFIPSIGQGTLAVEFKKSRSDLQELLAKIEDKNTSICAAAERAFTTTVGGGCKTPIGCYAVVDHDQVRIYGVVANEKSSKIYFESSSGPKAAATAIAKKVASTIIAASGINVSTRV